MNSILLNHVLHEQAGANRLRTFAILVLGVTESISSGVLSASDAVRSFFTADNCVFVKKSLKNRKADEIMAHGVQLPDLFDALTPDEAARELREEIRLIQQLSHELLDRTSLAT